MQSLDSSISWEYSGRLITTVFSSLAKRCILRLFDCSRSFGNRTACRARTSRKVVKWPLLSAEEPPSSTNAIHARKASFFRSLRNFARPSAVRFLSRCRSYWFTTALTLVLNFPAGTALQQVAVEKAGTENDRPRLLGYLTGGDALPSFTDGSRPQTRSLPSSTTKAESPSSPGRARTPSSSALAIPAFSSSGIAE